MAARAGTVQRQKDRKMAGRKTAIQAPRARRLPEVVLGFNMSMHVPFLRLFIVRPSRVGNVHLERLHYEHEQTPRPSLNALKCLNNVARKSLQPACTADSQT